LATPPPAILAIVTAYAGFIATLRKHYPNSLLVCTLGSMDATKDGSPWPKYISTAVATLHDSHVVTYFFPYKQTPGHPKRKEQAAMANGLTAFIAQQMHWKVK